MSAYRSNSETRDAMVHRLREQGTDKETARKLAEQSVRNASETIDRAIQSGRRKT
jgi:hypothetical protein